MLDISRHLRESPSHQGAEREKQEEPLGVKPLGQSGVCLSLLHPAGREQRLTQPGI